MTSPPDYVLKPFFAEAHNRPADSSQLTALSQDQVESLRGNLLESIMQVILQAITGVFTPGGGSAFDQLGDWAVDIPIVGDFVEAITGIIGGDLSDLTDWASDIPIIGDIIGIVKSVIFGGVPIGAITDDEPNLLPESLFALGSIAANPQWTVDPGNSRTADSSGAAKVLADGTIKALRSGETPDDTIPVAVGKTFTPEIYVKHTGYAGTGSPIQLHVVPFTDGVQGDPVVVDSYGPTGANLDWPGRKLSGAYAVPVGVDAVQVRLVVTAQATAGTIWFDDAVGKQTGLLQMGWIGGLLELLDGFTDGIPIVGQIVDAILGTSSGDGDLNLLNTIFGDLFGLMGDPADVGTGAPTPNPIGRIPVVGGLLDGLFGGFTGIFDQDADQAQVGDAASGVADSLAGTAATLSQIQAALAEGTPDSDDFERTNNGNWGPDWLVMEDGEGGNAKVDGHNAVWTADWSKDSEMVARRLLRQASGVNQTVSVVLDSSSGSITDGTAAVDLWLRMSAFTTWATRTGMRMRFWGNKDLELAWFNNGSKVWSVTGTSPQSASSGATLTFEAGQQLVPRKFMAKINSTPVLEYTEPGTASSLDNRWRGAGGRGEFSLIMIPPINMQPGKLRQWTATG